MVERSVRYRTKPKKSLISGSQHGNESQSKGSGPLAQRVMTWSSWPERGTQPWAAGVQGDHSQIVGLGNPVWCQGLDSMTTVGPFQLGICCDSMICKQSSVIFFFLQRLCVACLDYVAYYCSVFDELLLWGCDCWWLVRLGVPIRSQATCHFGITLVKYSVNKELCQ